MTEGVKAFTCPYRVPIWEVARAKLETEGVKRQTRPYGVPDGRWPVSCSQRPVCVIFGWWVAGMGIEAASSDEIEQQLFCSEAVVARERVS